MHTLQTRKTKEKETRSKSTLLSCCKNLTGKAPHFLPPSTEGLWEVLLNKPTLLPARPGARNCGKLGVKGASSYFFWGVLSFCMPRILSRSSATKSSVGL